MPDLGQKQKFPDLSTPTMESAGFAADGAAESVTGTTLTTGGVATKGVYVQLIASTTKKTIGITVHITKVLAGNRYWIDIATGGAGSEAVLITNIFINNATITAGNEGNDLFFPVMIPAGTRIAACAAAAAATKTICVSASLFQID